LTQKAAAKDFGLDWVDNGGSEVAP